MIARDEKLAAGGGDLDAVVTRLDLMDADKLRKLLEGLLTLVFQSSGVGVGAGGLDLLIELRK